MSHIFISYSKQNSTYAYDLADKLRVEGFDVWIDRSQLHTSQSWWPEIVQGLRGCSAFIVILTPQSDSSKWVQREILLADKWNKPSFPLLLEGDIESDNWSIFVGTQYADVRDGALPPPALYDDLAKYASRQSRLGADVTEKPSTVPIDAEVRQEIANPPPPEIADITQERRIDTAGRQPTRINSRTLLLVGAMILVAFVAILASGVLQQASPPATSTTIPLVDMPTGQQIANLDTTATEIMLQRTVDAKETTVSQSYAESTSLAETAHAPTSTPFIPPQTTATQVIDLGATATEALVQRTVDAQKATNMTLMAENTQIAASNTILPPNDNPSIATRLDNSYLSHAALTTPLTNRFNLLTSDDIDDDGYSDFEEVFVLRTDPQIADMDTDLDGLPDDFELALATIDPSWADPRIPNKDSDKDWLSDKMETDLGTDLHNLDSDNDAISDFLEIVWLDSDPLIHNEDLNINGLPDVLEKWILSEQLSDINCQLEANLVVEKLNVIDPEEGDSNIVAGDELILSYTIQIASEALDNENSFLATFQADAYEGDSFTDLEEIPTKTINCGESLITIIALHEDDSPFGGLTLMGEERVEIPFIFHRLPLAWPFLQRNTVEFSGNTIDGTYHYEIVYRLKADFL